MSDSFLLLGLDPGFADLGYALKEVTVLRQEEGGMLIEVGRVAAMGVIRTQKSKVKQNVLAADDNLRRTREITEALIDLLGVRRPQAGLPVRAICAEAMSFPRNASTAAKMSLTWGVIGALSAAFDVPVVQASPQAIKKFVAGKSTASKEEVQAAMDKRFRVNLAKQHLAKLAAGYHEHAYDALAAIEACSDGEVVRLARRMAAA